VKDFPFLCFDTEDNSKELLASGKSGFDKTVTQIAAITAEGKKYYNRGDVGHFKKWLLRQPERFFYAHNIQYDLGNLFADKLEELDVTMVGGRVIKAVWGNKVFVDSFNIWPMSAKKVGEAFKLKKLKTGSMATDKSYVFRDVEIIRQAMLFAWQFCDSLELKHLPPTLGGLCIKVWKHFGGKNSHDSNELSRESLYGGRVELFKRCNDSKQVCWTDINSLYPFVMLGLFPKDLQPFKRKLPKYGVARVTIRQPKTDFPVLPFRNEDGRILYPTGTFTGVWTILEIKAAVAAGAKVLKIHECYGSNEAERPYAAFVKKLYQARLDSKSDAEKLFFKLLMNNLYGRLGSSGKIGRSVWQNDQNKHSGIPYGDKVLVTYAMPLADETNWAHAAYITAYGRLELLKYMRLIGARAMIYCDTDSCIFDCPSKKPPFAIGPELGAMKLEGWADIALPYAPKLYRVGSHYKAKGVPKALAKEFIETGHAEFDLPFKMREAMRFFDRGNIRKLSVWRKVSKERQTEYDRKKLVGNRFYPCQVNQI
jgi:DNA polymerase type B, organellar and viral